MPHVVGVLIGQTWVPSPMIVDQQHDLGFAIGSLDSPNGPNSMVVYDLKTQKPLVSIRIDTVFTYLSVFTFAIDEANQRLYAPEGIPTGLGNKPLLCNAAQPAPPLHVFSYAADHAGERRLTESKVASPCLGNRALLAESASYDSTHGKLYLSGPYSDEQPHGQSLGTIQDDDGQSIIVRQVDTAMLESDPTAAVDWEVNLTDNGCGRRDVDPSNQVVARIGDDVMAYCSDVAPTQWDTSKVGAQGYVVRIPLDGNLPHGLGGSAPTFGPAGLAPKTILNPVVHRVPALSGPVALLADPAGRQLYLATADDINGHAIWVFDPAGERFVGVITGDFATSAPGIVIGIDPQNGRVYEWSPGSILVAPARHVPLATGLVYPTPDGSAVPFRYTSAVSSANPPSDPTIAVDSHLHRVFVPTPSGYEVFEDDTPEPRDATYTSPDGLTDPSLNEQPGVTQSTFGGAARASGARLLVTGGLTKFVNDKDPGCTKLLTRSNGLIDPITNSVQWEPAAFNGSCLSNQLFASGDRDFSLAATSLNTGAAYGASADAAALEFASGDSADPADINKAQSNDPDPTGKTQPVVGTPFTPADCNDGGGSPASAASPSATGGLPQSALAVSQVACNGNLATAAAGSSVSGLAVPGPATPLVSVGSMTSWLTSAPSAAGQQTTATATARGVVIGPLSIAQVMSQATTTAHGNTGTAVTTFVRQWCGIAIAGQTAVPGCVDPDADPNAAVLLATINNQLGSIRISAPAPNPVWDTSNSEVARNPGAAQTTPGGYQAVLTKDPGVQAADQTVNDDYSVGVPGLQVIRYDDGAQGRSRLIVQLANVESESRYGVTATPQFGSPGGGASPPTTQGASSTTVTAVKPSAPTATLPAPPGKPNTAAAKKTPAVTRTVPGQGAAKRIATPSSVSVMERPVRARFEAAPVSYTQPLLTLPGPGEPIVERGLRVPGQILKDAINLLVEKPGQFLLLAFLWTLLAAPFYLGLRRRARARALII
ncbi:MAG: DUF5585 domain-containing protein [Acidimicrobiales bacterium]